jgi:hypothetical protein
MHATRAAQLTALTQNRGRAVFQRKLCLEFDGSARHAGSYAPSRRSAFNQGNHASVWAGTPQPLRAADHTPNTGDSKRTLTLPLGTGNHVSDVQLSAAASPAPSEVTCNAAPVAAPSCSCNRPVPARRVGVHAHTHASDWRCCAAQR